VARNFAGAPAATPRATSAHALTPSVSSGGHRSRHQVQENPLLKAEVPKPPVYVRRGESGPIATARVAILNGELHRAFCLIRQMVAATGCKDLSIRLRQLIDEFIQAENLALVSGKGDESQTKAA
jgi:hypothetical protein